MDVRTKEKLVALCGLASVVSVDRDPEQLRLLIGELTKFIDGRSLSARWYREYPPELRWRPLPEQAKVFEKHFPHIKADYADVRTCVCEYELASSKYLIPRWQKLAPTYGEAVHLMLQKLCEVWGGKFETPYHELLGPDFLSETPDKVRVMRGLARQQPKHDLLVVSAQFGRGRRGLSAENVRSVIPGSGEFCLGAFEAGCMLLSHPERLMQCDDLGIVCAGDTQSGIENGACAPCFNVLGSNRFFTLTGVSEGHDSDGVVTGIASHRRH